MEVKDAIAFQEKLNEVLKDTEDFVNATKQLNKVKSDMEEYILKSSDINVKLSKVVQKTSECADYAGKYLKGDFTKQIQSVVDDLTAIVELCAEQGNRLKEQYDDLLRADNFKELQADHSNILDAVDEVAKLGNEIKQEELRHSESLQLILKLLQEKQE